jgi:hypothetical protein
MHNIKNDLKNSTFTIAQKGGIAVDWNAPFAFSRAAFHYC